MIVGIEDSPQIQPASCSFLGHDKNTAKWFVRLIAPNDVFYDTILMSDIAFREIAKRVGYVSKLEAYEEVEKLREAYRGLAINIDVALAEFDRLRTAFDSGSNVATTLEALRESVNNAVGVLSSTRKPSAVKLGSDKGSDDSVESSDDGASKSTAKS